MDIDWSRDEHLCHMFYTFIQNWEQDVPRLKLNLTWYTHPNTVVLNQIIIPRRFRNKGIGTKIIKELKTLANKFKFNIALTPSEDFGGNEDRLRTWYRSLGFKTSRIGGLWEELAYRFRKR